MSVPEQRLITGTAESRSGRISVETTEMGLPTAITVDRGELRRDPDLLAGEILRLCRQASARARLARRGELAAAGVARDVLDSFGLPTADEVALAELVAETEYDHAPQFRRQ
ncbi:hypothetical protein [Nocardia alni]|uniref:hypothetical protein n=1 Tax=Nocardia alni TaxID=2815723 RepID=UPI001C21A9AF|nr:hypothetical protein [Nocardia alni]